jgi:hypothetical protein
VWTVEAAEGQFVSVERGEKGVPQQQQRLEDKHFKIPRKSKTGLKALLVATEADLAGAV